MSSTALSLGAWCVRNAKVGALLGAVLGSVSAYLARRGPLPEGVLPPTWLQITGAVLVCAAFFAFVLVLSAAATWWLLPRFKKTAFTIHATWVGVWVLVHFTSTILRALSGAYLTRGVLEFAMAGDLHFFLGILGDYTRYVGLLLAIVALVAIAVVLLVRRELGRPETPRPRARPVLLAVPFALVVVGLAPARLLPGLEAASPEVALASSLDPTIDDDPIATPDEEESSPDRPTPKRPTVPGGLPQSEGARWRDEIAKLPPRKTNVILLTLESITPRHLGYMGYERDTTPNLDRIAKESLRMRKAWSTATHSNYAQMAILSSLFPRRSTGLDVYRRLDYPRVLLHDIMSQLGYSTATVSSQDETWQGMLKFQQTGTPTFYRHSKDYRWNHIDTGAELVVVDHVTVDTAIDWMTRQGDKPFSIYINFQATHFPYRLQHGVPRPFEPTEIPRGHFNYLGYPESDRQAAINRYDNALHYVDEQIGKLTAFLEKNDKLADTLWVITADHGESFHEHGQVTHGKTLYDAEARVPLLVHWPAKVTAGDAYEPVSTLDVLPTILDLLDVPTHPSFQGKSFMNKSAEGHEQNAVFMNIQGLRSAEAVVCWPWKLVVDRTSRTIQLYDLERDPDELDDRAKHEGEIARTLRATLSAQMTAQLAYHKSGSEGLGKRYAPKLLSCPELPGSPAAIRPPSADPDAGAAPPKKN
jgi:arylsulfatase A-like enzyme